VAHSHNPCYLGDRLEESWFEANPGKKFSRPHLSKQSGYGGSYLFQLCKKYKVEVCGLRLILSKKVQGSIQKIIKVKMGWGCDSSGRVVAWQVEGLSSNLYTTK
jgi:hypothetical protein